MASVTVLELGPCPVLQVRTEERDGYHAVQLGFKDKLRRKAIRSERGHVAADFISKRRKGMQDAGVSDQQWTWFTNFFNAFAARAFMLLDLRQIQEVDEQRRG